jgi:hypothetical protein
MPGWVKELLDDWLRAANLKPGKVFRRVNKNGKPGVTAYGKGRLARGAGVRPEGWHRGVGALTTSEAIPNPGLCRIRTRRCGSDPVKWVAQQACLGGECGIIRRSRGPRTAPGRTGTPTPLSASLCPLRPKLATSRRLASGLRACQEKRSLVGSIITLV